jgi:hypothetical protein
MDDWVADTLLILVWYRVRIFALAHSADMPQCCRLDLPRVNDCVLQAGPILIQPQWKANQEARVGRIQSSSGTPCSPGCWIARGKVSGSRGKGTSAGGGGRDDIGQGRGDEVGTPAFQYGRSWTREAG